MNDLPQHRPSPSDLEVLTEALQGNIGRILAAPAGASAADEGDQAGQSAFEAIQKILPLLLGELAALLPEVMSGESKASPSADGGLACSADHRLDEVIKLLEGTGETFVLEISRLKESVGEEFFNRARRQIRHFFRRKIAVYCIKYVKAQERELELRNHQLQEAAKELAAAPKNLKETAHSKVQLLEGIIHELRNALQSVLLYAGSLGEECDDSAVPELSERLTANAIHLQKLVDRIQLYSVFFSCDDRPVSSDTVNPDVFLNAVVNKHHHIAQATRTQVTSKLGGAPAFTTADAEKLAVIGGHLLSNAIESAPGGSVQIEMSEAGPEHLELKVVDSGRGITFEESRRLFRVMHRVANAPRSGLGLGLLMSRYLTLVLGGEITFQSEVGRGSSFAVKIPQRSPVQPG